MILFLFLYVMFVVGFLYATFLLKGGGSRSLCVMHV